MTHDAYLNSEAAQQSLQRAVSIANTSVSVFEYQISSNAKAPTEEDRLTGCGECAQACAYVSRLSWGAQACRKSREKAATASLKRQLPVPFLCHMGFSCVSMPALSTKDNTHALFFGPFCPSEAPDSLEQDALDALEGLENKSLDELPFSLDDIPNSPAATLPEIAQWLCESLTQEWTAQNSSTESPAESDVTSPTPSSRTRKRGSIPPAQAPFDAGAVVAALVGGDARQAKTLILSQIQSTVSPRRSRVAVKRARSIAVVATVLEWAEQADADTGLCWEKFTQFQASIQQWESDDEIAQAAMKVLSPIRRQVQKNRKRDTETQYDFVPMNTLITKHFKTGITLKDVAANLNENATTITKRLQRTFGLSFSQYVGQMKIEHAKKLFRTTKLNAGQVAQRIGLKDSANFAKLFRTHAQLSPSQYRTQFGKVSKK